jgi:hypothetical protein
MRFIQRTGERHGPRPEAFLIEMLVDAVANPVSLADIHAR